MATPDAEHAFLREFYLQGLGEFAYRNALDLTSLRLSATCRVYSPMPVVGSSQSVASKATVGGVMPKATPPAVATQDAGQTNPTRGWGCSTGHAR